MQMALSRGSRAFFLSDKISRLSPNLLYHHQHKTLLYEKTILHGGKWLMSQLLEEPALQL